MLEIASAAGSIIKCTLKYAGKHVGAVKNVNGGVVSVISGCGQAGIMGVLVKPGEFGENILHQIIVL